MGQTITAINLSAMISKTIRKNTILIDLNQYCKDIEYYLSDTSITKGLDDFYSLYSSNLLDKRSFMSCVKKVRENIDIMASNGCFEMDSPGIRSLLGFTENLYPITVVDTANRANVTPKSLLENSTVIIVVINQMKNVVQQISDSSYKRYKEKIVFVVNSYSEKIEGVKIKYRIKDIEHDLKAAGYENSVFPLDYDPEIINECNDHYVLNSILNKTGTMTCYAAQMDSLAKHILKIGGLYRQESEKTLPERRVRKAFPLINSF
jgi:cellulose biosynthesis protein BcsQ